MKTLIHVNLAMIRHNDATGSRMPVILVIAGGVERQAHGVEIKGPCRLVYRPERPLASGAKCWIETEGEVVIHDQA